MTHPTLMWRRASRGACALALLGSVACAPADDASDDTDASLDDTPPAMAPWLATFFPETRRCRVDLYDGETPAAGSWSFYDADGWPIASLSVYGGSASSGAFAPSAIDDPNLYVYLSYSVWNADHTKQSVHTFVSNGGTLTSDGADGGVTRLDEHERETRWTHGDTVRLTEYDAEGRKTRWDGQESTYAYWDDGMATQTVVRQFTCEATFPGTGSHVLCEGIDTRCDSTDGGATADCVDGDFSREVLTTYDADGYIAATQTTDVGLPIGPSAGEEPVADTSDETYEWTHGHTVVRERSSDESWVQSVFASAERARAYYGTVAPTYREDDGLELQFWSGGWSREVLSGDDCDLSAAPDLPSVLLSALAR